MGGDSVESESVGVVCGGTTFVSVGTEMGVTVDDPSG